MGASADTSEGIPADTRNRKQLRPILSFGGGGGTGMKGVSKER